MTPPTEHMSTKVFFQSELIERALRNARPHRTTPAKLWVAVKDIFAVGSTEAKQLCCAYGMDPYKEVGGVQCSACTEEDGE